MNRIAQETRNPLVKQGFLPAFCNSRRKPLQAWQVFQSTSIHLIHLDLKLLYV